MAESTLAGSDWGPFLLRHRLSDGTYGDVTSNDYSCKLKAGPVERDVTETGTDADGNTGFLIYLTPEETAQIGAKDITVAAQMENAALTPPLNREHHWEVKLREGLID